MKKVIIIAEALKLIDDTYKPSGSIVNRSDRNPKTGIKRANAKLARKTE